MVREVTTSYNMRFDGKRMEEMNAGVLGSRGDVKKCSAILEAAGV